MGKRISGERTETDNVIHILWEEGKTDRDIEYSIKHLFSAYQIKGIRRHNGWVKSRVVDSNRKRIQKDKRFDDEENNPKHTYNPKKELDATLLRMWDKLFAERCTYEFFREWLASPCGKMVMNASLKTDKRDETNKEAAIKMKRRLRR